MKRFLDSCREVRLMTLLALFSVCACVIPCFAAANIPKEIIRLGISSELDDARQSAFISVSLAALIEHLSPTYRVEVSRVAAETLLTDVKRNKYDLFLASSTLYRQSLLSGTQSIVVAVSPPSANPNRSDGALFLTTLNKAEKARIENWIDLRVSAAGNFSQTTITSLQDTVQRRSQRLFDAVSPTDIGGGLSALAKDESDVLILPVCALEEYAAQHDIPLGLMVISAQQDQSLPCLHSTQLFQGFTLVAMPSLSVEAFNRISAYLTEYRSSAARWALPTSFNALDKALARLNNDAWASVRETSWQQFIKRYWYWFAGVFILLGLTIANMMVLRKLVQRRTKELEIALAEQHALREDTNRTHERLDKLRRVQTIGQMASLFAHELRQPLNAVNCYAYGIRKLMKSLPAVQVQQVYEGLDGIDEQTMRASSIVNKVREYVKSQSSRNKVLRLSDAVAEAIRQFRLTSIGSTPITVTQCDPVLTTVQGDPLEIELIVGNLLRNSAQALSDVAEPLIAVCVFADERTTGVSVEDNGRALSQTEFENIVTTGDSTKPEGLGLGLSIIKDLAIAHRAEICFSLTSSRSLHVDVRFPRYEEVSDA